MKRIRLGRALGAGVATVAILSTLAALSMPVPERRAPAMLILLWLVLFLAQACIYEFGHRIRGRLGLSAYAGAQAAILFAIALSRPPAGLTIVLYMAAVAELVTLAGSAWGSVWITLGAVLLLVLAEGLTSDLYRATTDGLILAATGLIAHAIAALLHGPLRSPPRLAAIRADRGPGLSAREVEVLTELVNGARNSDIAVKLGISERTVKAHLGTIYRKLGVASRSGAVAAAVQLKLL